MTVFSSWVFIAKNKRQSSTNTSSQGTAVVSSGNNELLQEHRLLQTPLPGKFGGKNGGHLWSMFLSHIRVTQARCPAAHLQRRGHIHTRFDARDQCVLVVFTSRLWMSLRKSLKNNCGNPEWRPLVEKCWQLMMTAVLVKTILNPIWSLHRTHACFKFRFVRLCGEIYNKQSQT